MDSADRERTVRSGGARRRAERWPVSQIVGLTLLAFAALCAALIAAAPAPYAIERPGPVYDVLGQTTVAGEEVPLIEIADTTTYPTDGVLNMLTINANDPTHLPTWLEVVASYFDPSRSVLPIEAVYPPTTGEETNADRQQTQMENSKRSAIAAALTSLGYDLDAVLTVAEVLPGSAADGEIELDDVILSAGGQELADVDELREILAENGVDRPIEVVVLRDGEQVPLELTPQLSTGDDPAPVLGVMLSSAWDWPIDIRIQLENVGGPSAGMMFALGIIDKLTPGSLTGGLTIAGTGTIDAVGDVGAIGGIRQKMFGAVRNGATWFLAPATNCDSVVGHVPGGLQVVAVSTLDDAVAALEVISSGGDASALPSCDAVVAAQ